MDMNFTYTNNSSPNFAGMFTSVYDRLADRRKARAEAEEAATKAKATAEASQEGIAESTPTLAENTPRRISPGRPSSTPIKAATGQVPKQFTRVRRPEPPAAKRVTPGKPASMPTHSTPAKTPFKPAPDTMGKHARPTMPSGEPMGRHQSPNPPNTGQSSTSRFPRMGRHAAP